MQLLLQSFPNFLLIFCRITAFFVVAPVFSTRSVPAQFKIGLAFFASVLTFLTVGTSDAVEWDGEYILAVIREVLVGLLLGFTAYFIFTVVQMAGAFIDLQMGFGIANVIDPMTGTQSPILGNFKYIIAMLLFLSMNGHHYLLIGIMDSYKWVPLSNELFARMYEGSVSEFLVKTFARMFALALQMSAPLVVAMFLVDVALGILARTVPQLNIFVVGIPIKILAGFMVLVLIVPGFYYLFQDLFKTMLESVQQLLAIIKS